MQKKIQYTIYEMAEIVKKYNFYTKGYDKIWNNLKGKGGNNYSDNSNNTVTDFSTGLMWQQGGSGGYICCVATERYIRRLNQEQFAGYNDWRLPLIEELATLIDKKITDGCHVSTVFDRNQLRIRSATDWKDSYGDCVGYWVADLQEGGIQTSYFYHNASVRAVRQIPEL